MEAGSCGFRKDQYACMMFSTSTMLKDGSDYAKDLEGATCIGLVDRREKLPPLAREDLGVLLSLVSGKLLACPELHEEDCADKVDDRYRSA